MTSKLGGINGTFGKDQLGKTMDEAEQHNFESISFKNRLG